MKRLTVLAFLALAATGSTVPAQVAPEPPIRVTVTGEVANEGVFDLEPTARVTSALSLAGGVKLAPDRATLKISTYRVIGDQGKNLVLTVDLVALLEKNDPSQNARLHDGDVLVVAER